MCVCGCMSLTARAFDWLSCYTLLGVWMCARLVCGCVSVAARAFEGLLCCVLLDVCVNGCV